MSTEKTVPDATRANRTTMFSEPVFWVLVVAAALIGAFVPPSKGKWPAGPLSAGTAEKIIGGDKPAPTPRTGLQLGLLLVVVFVVAFMFGGRL